MSSRGGSVNDRRGDLGLFSHSRTCRDSDLIRESKTKESSYYLDSLVDIPSEAGPLSSRKPRTTANALFSPTIDSKPENDREK